MTQDQINAFTTTSINPMIDFLNKNIETISWFVYLLAALMFIQGLRYMNSPKTARRGNTISVVGMSLAVIMALFHSAYNGFTSSIALVALLGGILIGAIAGALSAKMIKMTAMPQLVSIFNTVGGGAAALIAINDALSTISPQLPKSHEIRGVLQIGTGTYEGKIVNFIPDDNVMKALMSSAVQIDHIAMFTASIGILIGCITFTGSLVAAGKLQGIINGNAIKIPGKILIDIICLLGAIFSGYLVTFGVPAGTAKSLNSVNMFGHYITYASWLPVILLVGFALIIGLTFVLPIGGADMPVVISVLNACTGTAVAMAGFVINNVIMIVAGALVGAAGAILSVLMAKAMNRSLINILAGGFGGDDSSISSDANAMQITKETSADDLAILMTYASRVIIVPGYGMAVAGAQHEIAEITDMLEDKGVEVLFAIHPVAGRMPGHMNVLLAEANIAYDKLLDLDDVNPLFSQTDVALVIGANDVTNPAARREGTPISGMPILDVDQSGSVVVIKRGRGKGYAGIENELYGLPNTSMLYGDAKSVSADIITALKEL